MNLKTPRFIATRTLFAVFALWIISLLTFVVVQLPKSDFVDDYLRRCNELCSDVNEFELRYSFGLNQPMLVQYGSWITGIIFRLDSSPNQNQINSGAVEFYVAEIERLYFENFVAARLIYTVALLGSVDIYIILGICQQLNYLQNNGHGCWSSFVVSQTCMSDRSPAVSGSSRPSSG